MPNVQSHGQLLPVDALQRILARHKAMPGMADADYHLAGERQNEAINRAWLRMLGLWRNFAPIRDNLSAGDAGTGQTRENLLLPLFQELGYGRLSAAKPEERKIMLPDGSSTSYAISHFRDESPIHLVGCNVPWIKGAPDSAGPQGSPPTRWSRNFLTDPAPIYGALFPMALSCAFCATMQA